jgi:hypothetical protein
MNPFLSHHRAAIRFAYSCFDRMIFNGYIPLLQHPGAVHNFLKHQRQADNLTRRYLSGISHTYHAWVDQFAQQQGLDLLELPKDARREEWVQPYFERLQGRPGIAVLVKALEPERIAVSYSKNSDAIGLTRRCVKVYYFYLQDAQAGRMFVRICPYFPFNIAVWMNGHEWLARQLRQQGIAFRQSDNCFLDCADPDRLQTLADALSPQDISDVVDSWMERLLPYFSAAERQQGYRHHLYMTQMEYCQNLRFDQRAALDRLFSRLMDLNREIGHPDKLAVIFGRSRFHPDTRTGETVLKVTQLRTPVISTGYSKTFVKQYVKERVLLRTETTSYRLRDLSINKNIQNLPKVREDLARCNDRYQTVQQDVLETFVDRGQLAQLRQPTLSASGRRTPGLRLDDLRLLAVLQALVRFVYLVGQGCFRTSRLLIDVREALDEPTYRLSQLRYDLGKLRGKGLVVRLPKSQSYQVTSEGYRLAVLYLKLYQRIYAPLTAGITAPFAGDARLLKHQQAKADRLYGAVDKALENLVKHFAIAS